MKKSFLKETMKINGMVLLGIFIVFLINWNTQNLQSLLWFGFLLWASANIGILLGIISVRKKLRMQMKSE